MNNIYIIQQLSLVDKRPVDMFPCILSKMNAIDKHLMEMIIHCAVKETGPFAMAENIQSWHELHAQKKEKSGVENQIESSVSVIKLDVKVLGKT